MRFIKIFSWLFLLGILAIGCGGQQEETLSFKATTINIKWDNPNEGNNRWGLRKLDIVNYIKYEGSQIIGLQEALYHQLTYLDGELSDYSWVGVGRDDGELKGEFSPLLVDTTQFTIMSSGTFWLSETPDVPSKGWDAALPRIATHATLKDRYSEEELFVLNTHFDHVGQVARAESMKVIQARVKELSKNERVIIMGDFNLEPSNDPIQSFIESGWQDAFEVAPLKFGPEATFNGYQYEQAPSRRIDYIFLGDGLIVQKYHVESALIEQRYLSDHFPVTIQLQLK